MYYILGAVAAVLLGTSFVLQQDAAQRAPGSDYLRLRLIADLLRQPRWLLGIVVMLGGQLLSAWVLGHMVLALTEPLLATNLLVALALAGRISGQRVTASEIVGALVLVAGVTALSVARSVSSAHVTVGSPAHWPFAGAAVAGAAALMTAIGRRHRGDLRGVLTGTGAGLVFGIQDALTRVTVDHLGSMHQVIGLLTSWPAYSLIAVGATGLWLMQNAFNAAPLHASLPGITAAEPVAGIVLGVVAFRDTVPSSPPMIALQAAGLAALVFGVVLVARAPALSSLSSHPPKAPPQPGEDGPGGRPDGGNGPTGRTRRRSRFRPPGSAAVIPNGPPRAAAHGGPAGPAQPEAARSLRSAAERQRRAGGAGSRPEARPTGSDD